MRSGNILKNYINLGEEMNIDEFKSRITRRGISRPNLFNIYIQPPEAIGYDTNQLRYLTFKAYSVDIPGKTIATSERRTHGPIQKVSYCDPIFPDITVSIICSDDLYERQVFDRWMNYIIKQNNGFIVEYYSRYTTKTIINKLDHEGRESMKYELIDSYPTNINSQKLDWSETDSYLTLDVTFTYRYYTYIGIN